MVPLSGKLYWRRHFLFYFFPSIFLLFYSTFLPFREKNKKWAEQGAALVCLYFLGVINKESLSANGNIISR